MTKKSPKKLQTRLVALVLVVTMMFGVSGNALAAISQTISTTLQIGQDTVYKAIDGEDSNGLQKVNYVSYKPNTGVSPIIAYGKGVYGKSNINTVTDYVESLGKEVIAGINADFFDLTSGVPIGIVIQNGVFISSNVGQYAVGFKPDGGAVIGKPAAKMTLTGPGGSTTIECFNKARSTYTVCMFDRNFGSETRINSMGKNIILERLEDKEVTVNSSIRLKVIGMENTAASTPIAANQMILTVSENGPLDRISKFNTGDELTFSVTNDDAAWSDVVYAVGGKNLISNGQVNTTGNPTGLAARSAIGVKSDGTVILYEVDGRQSDYSVGLNPSSLANELLSLGCVDAINLDGGGSSAMNIQKPGDSKPQVVNKPSDGSLRPCANYIFLVNNNSPTGDIKNLHIYPDNKYVLKGGQTKLTTKATDSTYYPVTAPTSLNYAVDGGMGSVDNGVFTAGSQSGTATIKVESNGITASQNVLIISSVSDFKVYKGSTAISSLKANRGETVELSAKAVYKGQNVGTSNDAFTWKVEGDIGSVSKAGVYTPGGSADSGNIVVSYGSIVKKIPVTLSVSQGVEASMIADFESTQPFTASGNTKLSLTKQFDTVYSGTGALKVNYDFSAGSSETLSTTNVNLGSNKYFYIQAKGDTSGLQISANFTNADGDNMSLALSGTLSSDKYQTLSCQVPTGAVSFTGLTLTAGNSLQGTIYLDHLILSTETKADTVYPGITITKVTEQVKAGENPTIIAKVVDNNGGVNLPDANIAVYVDGKKSAFTSNKANGNISLTLNKPSVGVHPVTIEAWDNFGNKARKSVSIQVTGEGNASTFTDLSGHWAKDYIDFVAGKGILKGEVDKKGNNLFYPKRNLTRAEFAVIIARYLELDTSTSIELPFADVKNIPDWALGSVKAVYAASIMTGSSYNDKTYFYPKDNIVRQEVMTVIGKSMARGYKNANNSFTDDASIAAWAKPHVNYLVSIGIVNGYNDGTIKPKDKITRAEIAKIIYQLY